MIDTLSPEMGVSPVDLKKGRRKKLDMPDPLKLDRLPPHSLPAEQGVLGCVLLSPGEGLGECIQKFKGQSAVFYDLRHRTIYETLVEMYDHKEAVDMLTVQ